MENMSRKSKNLKIIWWYGSRPGWVSKISKYAKQKKIKARFYDYSQMTLCPSALHPHSTHTTIKCIMKAKAKPFLQAKPLFLFTQWFWWKSEKTLWSKIIFHDDNFHIWYACAHFPLFKIIYARFQVFLWEIWHGRKWINRISIATATIISAVTLWILI